MLLGGFLDYNGMYFFNNMLFKPSRHTLCHKSKSLLPNAHTTILLNKISHRANTTFFPVSKISFWHIRLSHANHKAIHRTLQMCNISFNNKEPYSFCQSCCFENHIGCLHHCPMVDPKQMQSDLSSLNGVAQR